MPRQVVVPGHHRQKIPDANLDCSLVETHLFSLFKNLKGPCCPLLAPPEKEPLLLHCKKRQQIRIELVTGPAGPLQAHRQSLFRCGQPRPGVGHLQTRLCPGTQRQSQNEGCHLCGHRQPHPALQARRHRKQKGLATNYFFLFPFCEKSLICWEILYSSVLFLPATP